MTPAQTDPVSQCPYCLSRGNLRPLVGTKIIFLNGIDVGQSGSVAEDVWGTCPSDRFLVKMEYEQSDQILRTVMPGHDLFLDIGEFSVPPWMPPVSMDDIAHLHDSLPHLFELAVAVSADEMINELSWMIVTCWRRRLPLDGTDIWPLLEAHGAAPILKAHITDYFNFGVKLLVTAQGRPPVKRRRMPAMSQARYLTKKDRDLRLRLFGHT